MQHMLNLEFTASQKKSELFALNDKAAERIAKACLVDVDDAGKCSQRPLGGSTMRDIYHCQSWFEVKAHSSKNVRSDVARGKLNQYCMTRTLDRTTRGDNVTPALGPPCDLGEDMVSRWNTLIDNNADAYVIFFLYSPTACAVWIEEQQNLKLVPDDLEYNWWGRKRANARESLYFRHTSNNQRVASFTSGSKFELILAPPSDALVFDLEVKEGPFSADDLQRLIQTPSDQLSGIALSEDLSAARKVLGEAISLIDPAKTRIHASSVLWCLP